MKKNLLLKGAVAMTLCTMAASCSEDTDLYNPNQAQEELKANFEKNIMNGQSIDQNQTWNTAERVDVTVTTEMAGILKIYTANPVGDTPVSLATINLSKGTSTVTVAKPSDVDMLYAALFDTDGSVRVMEMKGNSVTFTAPRSFSNAARRTARVQKRYNVDFPDAPTFVSSVPEGAVLARDYNDGEVARAYCDGAYIDASVKKVNIWGGWDGQKTSGGVLYVTGNVQLDYFYVAPNTTVYVTANSTLSIPAPSETASWANNNGHSENLQAGCNYYLAPGAKLVTNGHLKLNSTNIWVSSTAEVTSPTLECNGVGIFYNQGKAEFTGDIAVENANSFIINEGTLTAENYGDFGSGNFWNTGDVVIRGTTTVNSNANVWINEGTYTTKDFTYTAGSVNVWNLCKLTVTNLFDMTLGDSSTSNFSMDSGSSMIIKDFHIAGPARINMAGNSIIKVSGDCTMDCRKADYGIFGPTSGEQWAVFQAKDIKKGIDNQGYEVTYGGNLYVACDSHFANGYSGQYPYIDFVGEAKLVEGQTNAPYTIPANGKCSDGYTGGTSGSRIDDDPIMYYYYAFEDLGNTQDIDFNDVILRVSAPVNGTCSVQLCAAGGELKTKVLYNGTVICDDVHTAMGGTMLNTTSVDINKFTTLATLEDVEDASNLPFAIQVENRGTSVTVEASGLGQAPLMIKVSGIDQGPDAGKWFWAREQVYIQQAYNDFVEWATDRTKKTDWYKRPVSDKVVSY